jgi:hypothetical protein
MTVEATVSPRRAVIPEGTAVQAYPKYASEVERREDRPAIPAATANGVIKNGAVTLKGLAADTDYVLKGVVDEIQSVKIDATAGQFKLTFEAQQTGNIAYNATAEKVREELEALSNIGAEEVEVTGGPGDSGGTKPYVVKFLGTLAGKNVAAMTVANGTTPLSGGGGAGTVSTTTQGAKAGSGGIERSILFRSPAA